MSPGPRPGPARRQKVIDALCEAFAWDEMGLEDFERRVETAHRADTAAELDALLADLLSASPPARAGGAPAPRPHPRARSAPPRPWEVVAGLMGGSARRGRWEPARRITALAIMGGVELDFREAVLLPGVTEVQAFAFLGGIEILAPPGVRLESAGIGIMGGFDHGEGAGEPVDPSAPTLRVTGVALMGVVDIKVRYPGESGRGARRRVREERRQRRLPDGGTGPRRPGTTS